MCAQLLTEWSRSVTWFIRCDERPLKNVFPPPPQRSHHIVFVVITVHLPEHPPASCDRAVLRCVMTQELSLLFNQTAISQQEDVRGQSQLCSVWADYQIRTKKPEMNRIYLALLA